MRIILFLWILILFNSQGTKKDELVTEEWLKNHFGERYISAQEAGINDLTINFSKNDLKFDKTSWLVPLEREGKTQYELIQARYIPSKYEKFDTLTLKETIELFRITNQLKRTFPNSENTKVILTKDKVNELDKTLFVALVIGDNNCPYSTVFLPKFTQLSSADKSISVVSNSILMDSTKAILEIRKVITLVRLIK